MDLELKSEKTGEFCFQFDDNEPIRLSDIMNYSQVTINIGQSNPSDWISTNSSTIQFNDNGRTFKLFIRDCK